MTVICIGGLRREALSGFTRSKEDRALEVAGHAFSISI